MVVVERIVHWSRESGRGQDYRPVYRFRLAYASLVALGRSSVVGPLNLESVSASRARWSSSVRRHVSSLSRFSYAFNGPVSVHPFLPQTQLYLTSLFGLRATHKEVCPATHCHWRWRHGLIGERVYVSTTRLSNSTQRLFNSTHHLSMSTTRLSN